MNEQGTLQRLLIFDDDADFRRLLLVHLRKSFSDVEIDEYDPVARGVPDETFDWSRYDILILDYYLCIHNVTGLDILQANRKNRQFPATIMLTGAGNEEVAVRALKAGVYDYLRKENLNRDQLRKSILDAFEKHKVEVQRLNELTSQSNAFNKALFYQELEEGNREAAGKGRILMLVQLDEHQKLEERLGIIMRDSIVRHMARETFNIFQMGNCNPHITRLNDDCVALIIDDPESAKTLEFNLNGLCTHLKRHPYRFEDRKFRFTVSVGVVPIPRTGRSADLLIRRAHEACELAAREGGNTFHIAPPVDTEAPAMPAQQTGPGRARGSAEENPPETSGPAVAANARGQTPPDTQEMPGPTLDIAPTAAPVPAPSTERASAANAVDAGPPAAAPASTAEPAGSDGPAPPSVQETGRDGPGPAQSPAPETFPEGAADKPAPDLENGEDNAANRQDRDHEAAPAPSTRPELEKSGAPASESRGAIAVEKPAPQGNSPEPAVPAPARTEARRAVAGGEEKSTPAPVSPAASATLTAPDGQPEAARVEKAERDDADLNDAQLDEAALRIKKAFDEKRIVQTFQPIISLVNAEDSEAREVYRVRIQMIDRDGSEVQESRILEAAAAPAFRKFIDRWVLRETIGRIVNSGPDQYLFVISLSNASMADQGLFNWLRKLLSGLEERDPGRSIALELAADDYSSVQRKAKALMEYLGKTHGFQFVLGQFRDAAQLKAVFATSKADLLQLPMALFQALESTPADGEDRGTLRDRISAGGARFIVEDVQDANTLTTVISSGAQFAMGRLIGDPVTRLGDTTNVETFEIS